MAMKDTKLTFNEEKIERIHKKSRAKTLGVTAVLKFEKPTMLAANVLVEGKGFDENKDYVEDLVTKVNALLSNPLATVDEHHVD